jgi:hypothetical protein
MISPDLRRRRCSVAVRHREILTRPRSAKWFLVHDINYTMGGLCFIPASCMSFVQVSAQTPLAFTVAGWLFSIGSLFLLLADLQEWWYFRIGCVFDCKYRGALWSNKVYVNSSRCVELRRRCDRAKIGVNIFASACGSALYLVGSILSIPGFEAYVLVSQALIIAGSIVIFLSQVAKLYRSGCIENEQQTNGRFRLSNWSNTVSTVIADMSAALGAIFYLIGTVLFLAQFNIDQIHQDKASALYVCGGVGFAVSGFFLFYDDFCSNKSNK